ncbi:SDR family oxidoreductase [Pelotomaculum terephthalicicum JT]|uniref:SDR family oxidoreductase n=1 Tax=Pelotomaculum TaxID=191373 RepID=UPI0009C87594|nr:MULTISPECIES: SDR family oxidoreductase [Pelotomaculum]MCG9967995.1 SDR family oxidoreductase [Pelotomaculum terephthalicicum JT]OPX88595.1 MAG: 2-dehydro-3-deoxy-D-gluconate 5-dehydrogenase [Pelotomaculum sp. PtaB.Bin117]OPY63032.1 MAG: 2-dehydro-3-deoxy-D-gluconate 5-dehydrogenase [Pelotomaculum sp. PtaU1.Bin065]
MMNKTYSELFSLKGKTAVVTGGIGILGKHFCSGLAEFGANVAVVDLDEKAAGEFAAELAKKYGIKATGLGCDVSAPESVNIMVSKVVETFGEINILHNNAAGKSTDLNAYFAPTTEYSPAEWRRIMSVNMDGMFLVAQATGRQMIAQGKGGTIIQTASIYGVMGPDHRIYEGSYYLNREINTPAVYAASKAAVIGLTKYLATLWADMGIRVNTITPGGVESGQNDIFKKNYSTRVPLGRMAQPQEMVGALIYLASDASSYVTGQNVIVDGGLSAW